MLHIQTLSQHQSLPLGVALVPIHNFHIHFPAVLILNHIVVVGFLAVLFARIVPSGEEYTLLSKERSVCIGRCDNGRRVMKPRNDKGKAVWGRGYDMRGEGM